MNLRTQIATSNPIIQSLLKSPASPVVYFDANFNIVDFNFVFTTTMRFDTTPTSLYDIPQLFSVERWEDCHLRLMNGQSEFESRRRITFHDGSMLSLHIQIIGEYVDNQFVGGLLLLNDVTTTELTQRSLKKGEEVFFALYEHSPMGVLIVGKGAKILKANPRICEMLGYTEEELQQLTAYYITHPDDQNAHKQKYMESLSGKNRDLDFEKRYIRKDGKIVHVRITASIVKDINDIPIYDLAIVEDISEKKYAEQALKDKEEQLNQNHERLEAFADSNHQLENFAYIASHDLKAPLRTMRSFASLLKRRTSEKLSSEENEYLDFIISGAKEMNHLIENLLLYSKMNSSADIVEKLDFKKLIKGVLLNLNALVSEQNVEVIIEETPVEIVGNFTRLTQLFQNLISNGIKFQRPDTRPVILIKGEEKECFWQFQITDNGIGISKEYYQQIFDLFKRLHNKNEFEGTGIGLAYCKGVVEKHGGKIWIESEEGSGSTFFFTIKKPIIA